MEHYKIAYFKIHTTNKLEIGLLPADENIKITNNTEGIMSVPPSIKVMTFNSGDPWPFRVPKLSFYSWDSAKMHGSTQNLLMSISESFEYWFS
jgi:hypothetical protein